MPAPPTRRRLRWAERAGDPTCAIAKPGEKYQYFRTSMVVVMNVERDEPITRRLLWDEVRPALSLLAQVACPRAKGVTYRIARDKRVSQRKALHDKRMQAYYKALSEAMKVIEKQGWGPSIFKWISGNGGRGNRTPCSARANSLINS